MSKKKPDTCPGHAELWSDWDACYTRVKQLEAAMKQALTMCEATIDGNACGGYPAIAEVLSNALPWTRVTPPGLGKS